MPDRRHRLGHGGEPYSSFLSSARALPGPPAAFDSIQEDPHALDADFDVPAPGRDGRRLRELQRRRRHHRKVYAPEIKTSMAC